MNIIYLYMISRDTTVHIGAVLLAILLFMLIEYLNIWTERGDLSVVAALLIYGLVFGGAHFYLALRGEDGMIPVVARWRYVALLCVLLLTAAVSIMYGTQTIAGIEISTIALLVAVFTLVVYLVTENISAYRTSMAE